MRNNPTIIQVQILFILFQNVSVHGDRIMVFGRSLRWIFKQFGKRKLPLIDGQLKLEGLLAPVEVIRDKWGIPHIYAENTHDLFFAQGFVQAQDRLWQMELN